MDATYLLRRATYIFEQGLQRDALGIVEAEFRQGHDLITALDASVEKLAGLLPVEDMQLA